MRLAEPRRIGQERLSGVNEFVLEDPERHRRPATGVAALGRAPKPRAFSGDNPARYVGCLCQMKRDLHDEEEHLA
jgi:hypothetical protein